MKRILLTLTACLMTGYAAAQPVETPAIRAGDHWVYRSTSEKGPTGSVSARQEIKVSRVTSSTIFYSNVMSTTQIPQELFSGLDWSRTRSINGKETTITKALSFPLEPGKAWDLSYEEENPGGNYLKQRRTFKFIVVGNEVIEVPAGKFNAIKIEAEGHWHALVAAGESTMSASNSSEKGSSTHTQTKQMPKRETTGRLYKVFWYVPEIKRWAKSVEENYSSTGRRNERFTMELESYAPGK
jgi:hypothetical protein